LPGTAFSDQRVDLRVVGEASGLELGEAQRAVDGDLERADGARRRLDLVFSDPAAGDQPVLRTEGARAVVSALAVFDADFHGLLLHRSPEYGVSRQERPYHVAAGPGKAVFLALGVEKR